MGRGGEGFPRGQDVGDHLAHRDVVAFLGRDAGQHAGGRRVDGHVHFVRGDLHQRLAGLDGRAFLDQPV